jgi:hypothetical protein
MTHNVTPAMLERFRHALRKRSLQGIDLTPVLRSLGYIIEAQG